MKSFPFIFLSLLFFSFAFKNDIGSCYYGFNNYTGLTGTVPERYSDADKKPRQLQLRKGKAKIKPLDGYKIDYKNEKNAVFVKLRIEQTDESTYGEDTLNVLSNLQKLASKRNDLENKKELSILRFNSYVIHGYKLSNIDQPSTERFVIFPAKGIILYFDFFCLRSEERHYLDPSDYRGERNGFLGNYTFALRRCADK